MPEKTQNNPTFEQTNKQTHKLNYKLKHCKRVDFSNTIGYAILYNTVKSLMKLWCNWDLGDL